MDIDPMRNQNSKKRQSQSIKIISLTRLLAEKIDVHIKKIKVKVSEIPE